MDRIEIVKNYFVNSSGEVYNKDGMRLKTSVSRDGYEIIPHWVDGKFKTRPVHRWVAEAFIPNPENKPCVNHIDGSKTNNKVSNLEWVTYSENTIHALETGLKIVQKGEDVHNASITNEVAHEICRLIEQGLRNKEIVSKLNVSSLLVKQIRGKKSWTHISENYKLNSKSHIISEDTVHWICKRLSEGFRNKDIVEMSNNPRVTKALVTQVRNKRCHKHISDLYSY